MAGDRFHQADQLIEPAARHDGVIVEQHDEFAAASFHGFAACFRDAQVGRRPHHFDAYLLQPC